MFVKHKLDLLFNKAVFLMRKKYTKNRLFILLELYLFKSSWVPR